MCDGYVLYIGVGDGVVEMFVEGILFVNVSFFFCLCLFSIFIMKRNKIVWDWK